MRITVDTQDHTEPVVREVFTLQRDALAVDLVGLYLVEAHELLTALREVLVTTQTEEALDQRRCCAHRGRAYRYKDTKKITLRTLFGTLDVDSPRWLSCPCHSGAMASFCPLATALAEHATPGTGLSAGPVRRRDVLRAGRRPAGRSPPARADAASLGDPRTAPPGRHPTGGRTRGGRHRGDRRLPTRRHCQLGARDDQFGSCYRSQWWYQPGLSYYILRSRKGKDHDHGQVDSAC